MLEEGEITDPASCVEVVADKGDPLRPVQRLVDRRHDGEFRQNRNGSRFLGN